MAIPLGQRWPAWVLLMTMTEHRPLAGVRAHLSETVGRVHQETIAVLSDSETVRQLAASEAELARGEGQTAEALVEAMNRRRASASVSCPTT